MDTVPLTVRQTFVAAVLLITRYQQVGGTNLRLRYNQC